MIFYFFISLRINTCPGQCMWTRSWKSGNKPFWCLFVPWISGEKKTLIGVSHREHCLPSNSLFSKERSKISVNNDYGLPTKRSFTGQHSVLACKWFVYYPHCCLQSLLVFTWWFRNVITEQIYDKNCMCIMFKIQLSECRCIPIIAVNNFPSFNNSCI